MRNVIKQTSHSAPSAKQADSLPSKAGQKRKTNYSRGSSTQRIKSLSKTTKRSHHTEKVAVRSGDGQKHTRGRDRTQAPKRKQRKMSKNPQTLGGRDQVTLNRDGSTKSPRKPRNQGDSKPARSSETKIKEASPKTMLETRGGPQNDVQGSFTSPRKKNNNTNENASADGEATATTYSLVVEVERVPESSRFRAWGFLRRIKTVAKKKSKADFEINDSALQTKNGTHKVTKRSFRYLPRILRRSHRVRARSSG